MRCSCRLFLLQLVLLTQFGLAQSDDLPLTPEQEKRADMRLPELDRSALEPDKRLPVTLREGERIPFGLLSVPPPEEEETIVVEAETEEMKIRRILGNMRVTGRAGVPGAYRVQLGMIQLQEGEVLPRLFANQGEDLRVDKITERQIIFNFIERQQANEATPRSIGLGYDLSIKRDRVRSLLPGEVFAQAISFDQKGAPNAKPLASQAVDDFLKQVEEEELTEALTDHRRAFLGETIRSTDKPSASDEKDE